MATKLPRLSTRVSLIKIWTVGILFIRKIIKAEEALLGIYARYQFSGT